MPLTRSGRRGLFVVLVVLVVLAAACSSADDSATDDGTADDTAEATVEPSSDSVPRAPGFDGETITLGVLTAETGPFADSGQAVTAGNRLYWMPSTPPAVSAGSTRSSSRWPTASTSSRSR